MRNEYDANRAMQAGCKHRACPQRQLYKPETGSAIRGLIHLIFLIGCAAALGAILAIALTH